MLNRRHLLPLFDTKWQSNMVTGCTTGHCWELLSCSTDDIYYLILIPKRQPNMVMGCTTGQRWERQPTNVYSFQILNRNILLEGDHRNRNQLLFWYFFCSRSTTVLYRHFSFFHLRITPWKLSTLIINQNDNQASVTVGYFIKFRPSSVVLTTLVIDEKYLGFDFRLFWLSI